MVCTGTARPAPEATLRTTRFVHQRNNPVTSRVDLDRTFDSAAQPGYIQDVGVEMNYAIDLEQEDDGRWIGEVTDLSGVMAYGQTRGEVLARVQALALRVIAERLEHGEAAADLLSVSFRAA